MQDNEEYATLTQQISTAEQQYELCQFRIEKYDYLLGRLRHAKENITVIKHSFKLIVKSDKDKFNDKYCWNGSTYSTFSSKINTIFYTNEEYYKNSLDYALDSINNEITRIENERMKEYGILGELGSLINSLANKIENFFN